MWGAIHKSISQYLRQPFTNTRCKKLTGSGHYQAVVLDNGKQRFLVKVNEKQAIQNFDAEIDGLIHLSQQGGVNTPAVIDVGTTAHHSFLILEFLPLARINSEHWHSLGEMIAQLHLSPSQGMYGWQQDNFVGDTLQTNQWRQKWRSFFAEQRILPLLEELNRRKLLSVNTGRIIDHIQLVIKNHQPISTLLHGDLWIGNVGISDQKPYLFDPAIYYGDREVDIAMTELFGRFPNTFYSAYHHHYPLEKDYEFRKPIYQLYPLLNHALLFKGHYIQAVSNIISTFDSH